MIPDLAHASAQPSRKGIVTILAVPFFLFLRVSAFGQAQTSEYEVKAAFIFHFAQMVEWPADVLGANTQPLVICTLEDDS
jgi:hypothetical protein